MDILKMTNTFKKMIQQGYEEQEAKEIMHVDTYILLKCPLFTYNNPCFCKNAD